MKNYSAKNKRVSQTRYLQQVMQVEIDLNVALVQMSFSRNILMHYK